MRTEQKLLPQPYMLLQSPNYTRLGSFCNSSEPSPTWIEPEPLSHIIPLFLSKPLLRVSCEEKMSKRKPNSFLKNSTHWLAPPSPTQLLDRSVMNIWSYLSPPQLENRVLQRAQPRRVYIALAFFFFASVTAVAGENLAHILLNQSAAIVVDSETWQVVSKRVLFNSLFTISQWREQTRTHRFNWNSVSNACEIWKSQSMYPGIVWVCEYVFSLDAWSTFNPYFLFIWSLMRLLSQFKETKMLSSTTATLGLVYQHHY